MTSVADQPGRTHAFGGVLWTLSGTASQAVVRMIVLVLLARLLGPAPFGVFGAALVIVNFAIIVAQLGIGTVIIQRVGLTQRYVGTAVLLAVFWGAAVTGTIHLLAPRISELFGFDGLAGVIMGLGVQPLIVNLGVVPEGLLRRELAFRRLTIVSMISFVIGGVVGISLALLGAGTWALVMSELSESGVRSLVLAFYCRKAMVPFLDLGALREILRFSGGLTSWWLGQAIAQSVDNIVVGRWLGVDALGLYTRAYQLTSVPASLIGRAVLSVLFPIMARLQADHQRLAGAYRGSVAVFALLGFPAAAMLIVLAPELVLTLFGTAWSGVVTPLRVLALGMFFRTSFQLSNAVAAAGGAVYSSAWRHGVYAVVVFAGATIGQRWGLRGVAIGVTAAQFIHFILISQLSLKLSTLKARPFLEAHLRGLVLAAVTAAELGVTVSILRRLDVSGLWLLGLALATLLLSGLIALRLAPRMVLGAEGLWLLNSLLGRLPARLVARAAVLGLNVRPSGASNITPVPSTTGPGA